MSNIRGRWFMTIGLLMLLALAAGLCVPVQSAANARLATQGTGSSVMATTVNTGVSLLTLLLIVSALYFAGLVPSRPQGGLGQMPWWGWSGGVLGAVFVFSLAFLAPRLGVATTIGLVVCAQILTSLSIDHFGWLGLQSRRIDWPQVGGGVLIVAGVFLVQWRHA